VRLANCNVRDRILAGRTLADYTVDLIQQDARNYINPKQFLQRNLYFFTEPPKSDIASAILDQSVEENLMQHIDSVMATDIVSWTPEGLDARLKAVSAQACQAMPDAVGPKNVKEAQRAWTRTLYHTIRTALMRGSDGPSLTHTMAILGREVCRSRYHDYCPSRHIH